MSHTARLGFLSFAVALVLFGAALGVVLLPGGEPAAAPAKAQDAARRAASPGPAAGPPRPADDGPWPECGACLAWLRDHLGEPASLQVIEWEHRGVGDNGAVSIELRYRAKNKAGAMAVDRMHFQVLNGKVDYGLTDQEFFRPPQPIPFRR